MSSFRMCCLEKNVQVGVVISVVVHSSLFVYVLVAAHLDTFQNYHSGTISSVGLCGSHITRCMQR